MLLASGCFSFRYKHPVRLSQLLHEECAVTKSHCHLGITSIKNITQLLCFSSLATIVFIACQLVVMSLVIITRRSFPKSVDVFDLNLPKFFSWYVILFYLHNLGGVFYKPKLENCEPSRMRRYFSYLPIFPLSDIFGWLEFCIVLLLLVL